MTALSDDQLHLIRAAKAGELTISAASRFRINGVDVDVHLGWIATDMLRDGLLFLPPVPSPRKYRPVRPGAGAIAALPESASREECP